MVAEVRVDHMQLVVGQHRVELVKLRVEEHMEDCLVLMVEQHMAELMKLGAEERMAEHMKSIAVEDWAEHYMKLMVDFLFLSDFLHPYLPSSSAQPENLISLKLLMSDQYKFFDWISPYFSSQEASCA